jgi:DNA polymerase-3 subunit chi
VTHVAFHFGATDKFAYTCRLLRKAVGSGARVVVLAQPNAVARLDAGLWGVSATDFVPHSVQSGPASVVRNSPLVMTSVLNDVSALGFEVLVQLCSEVPADLGAYQRVVEVVGLDDLDRAEARVRWRSYAALGLSIQKHDLALKESF